MKRLSAIAPKGEDAQATILVIDPDEDGEGAYLFRYTTTEFAGDTWHENVALAQEQAEFEFGISSDNWMEIPDEVRDPVAYRRAQAR